MFRILVAALLASALGACSSGSTLGHRCSSDDQCSQGTSCVDPSATFVPTNDAGCMSAGLGFPTFCTRVCTTNSDCTSIDPSAVCAPNGCGATGLCLLQRGSIGTVDGG